MDDLTTAATTFSLVSKELSALVSKLGFVKKRNVYLWDSGDLLSIVGLQKSRSSTKDCIIFTVNFSVLVKALLDPEFDNQASTNSYSGHLYWRVGDFLKPPADKWWKIDKDTDPDHVTESFRVTLSEFALPEFQAISSLGSVMEVLNSERRPPMGERQRQRLIEEISNLLQ